MAALTSLSEGPELELEGFAVDDEVGDKLDELIGEQAERNMEPIKTTASTLMFVAFIVILLPFIGR
jgi:hypothetical protein